MIVTKNGVTGFVMHGKLAHEYCGLKLELQVCRSASGFYIGTLDQDSMPCSRESEEYYNTRDEAKEALDKMEFTQRTKP